MLLLLLLLLSPKQQQVLLLLLLLMPGAHHSFQRSSKLLRRSSLANQARPAGQAAVMWVTQQQHGNCGILNRIAMATINPTPPALLRHTPMHTPMHTPRHTLAAPVSSCTPPHRAPEPAA
jgi:hypothetical protein